MNEQQRLKPFPHTTLITQSIPTPDGWVKEMYRRDEPVISPKRLLEQDLQEQVDRDYEERELQMVTIFREQ